jgi:hypothetical protein
MEVKMNLQTLPQRQAEMKRRNNAKATRQAMRPLGRAGRKPISPQRNNRNCAGGQRSLPRRVRRVQVDWNVSCKRRIERYRNQKDFLSAKVIVDGDMITNVPVGRKTPPEGKPWIYYLFVTYVGKHRGGKENRIRYVEEISGKSKRGADKALLKFSEQKGVKILKPGCSERA